MARENITVLFAELVGLTPSSSALAQDTADQLRQAYFSALREVILAAGGAVREEPGRPLAGRLPIRTGRALVCRDHAATR